jgi:TolB protein
VDTSPDWSPDGGRIVFTSGAQGRPQIFIMPAGGGSPQRMPSVSAYAAEPSWSPDGNRIAYTAGSGGAFQVAVYDLLARQGKFVSKTPGDAIEPCWLADSRHLVFTQRSANQRHLAILDTETGRITRITDDRLGRAAEADYLDPR